MSNKSRTALAAKNFIWATIGNLLNSLLSFISRTVFIYTLGTVYLGINGLFTNVLGMLSLAELGIGSAISFSLYKPLAEHDEKKIQAIINFYRTAYRIIAGIVCAIGICIIPFLDYIVKGAESIDNIILIYCIFLFNTVTSYLITYKTTLLSADQRNYLITNINTVVKIITVIVQTVLLLIFKSFIFYLISNATIQLLSKFYMNSYTDKQYPYIRGRNTERLSKNDKNIIFRKIKALIFHKVGEVSIYQTDNIITSAFINVGVVGLVSNYVMIINTVNTFIMAFFNAAVAGLGNVIATENTEKRLTIFKNYDFLGFWFFGWSGICLYFLLSLFVSIWIGEDKLIDNLTVALLCMNYYFTGLRVSLGNIKAAAGVYEPDKWAPIVQSILNIGASIVGAKYLGLPGIYIGTLLSSMVPNIVRPIVVYKYIFSESSKMYFVEYFKRIIIICISVIIVGVVECFIGSENKFINIMLVGILCLVIPNVVISICYKGTNERAFVENIIKKIMKVGNK